MPLSPNNLTFEIIREAYVSALEGRSDHALRITSDSALFLKGDNLYFVAVGPTGRVETEVPGYARPPVWDEYLGSWEDVSPEATVAAVNSPVFIDIGPEPKGSIAMLTYPLAMAAYRALLESRPGQALRLGQGPNSDAAAIVDGELCCVMVGPDNVADLSTIGDLMSEAWGIGGWHSDVEETRDAIENPVFVDIRP